MGLEDIIAISGKPGLFKMITQTRNGFIAESLLDKKRLSVTLSHNVSVLSEIAIYTLTEEVPLRNVFKAIREKESGKKTTVSHKANKTDLEAYFFDILPDFDEDRVYASDIKKIIQWYNLLHDNDLIDVIDAEPKASDKEEATK